MAIEHRRALPWPHFVTGRDDHVLLAVHQVEPAVLVHEADVASEQLTTGQAFRGCLWVVPVARDDLRTRSGELTDFADGHFLAHLVEDSNHCVEHWHTHRQRPGVRVHRRLLAQRYGVRRRVCLGQTIDVMDIETGLFHELVGDCRRDRRTPGVDDPERGPVLPGHPLQPREVDEHRDRADGERGAVNVGRCSRIASMTTPGSNRWLITSGHATSSATPMWPISPVTWNSGATPRTESLAVNLIQSR